MSRSILDLRSCLSLLALAGLAGSLGAAEPIGPIASSVERAVAGLDVQAPPSTRPLLCGAGCGGVEAAHDPVDPPFMKSGLASGIGFVVGLSSGIALGQTDGDGGTPSLRPGWQTADSIVAGTTLAAWAATRLLDRAPQAPGESRWSDCDGTKDALNGLDRRVAEAWSGGRWRKSASVLSDMTLWSAAALPVGVLAGASPDAGGRDVVVIGEALLVNAALHDVVRRFFDRPRPCAHFCRLHGRGDGSAHARSSFYSGHTSTAFTMAVTAGMLSHYHRSRGEGWVWASGLTLAATTGVLRIVADEHYFTDVAAGAVAGALVGYLIPRIHRPEPAPHAEPGARLQRPAALVSLPLRLPGLPGQGDLRAGVGSGFTIETSWRW